MSPGFDPDAPAQGGGIYGLPHAPADAAVVLIPVPWEPTTSYRKGTAGGPAAILKASAQVDLFDLETGRPYRAGIAMLDEDPRVRTWNDEATSLAEKVIEAGGANTDELRGLARQVDGISERLNAWLHTETTRWLDAGKLVGVVGGDHASPFGAIQAISERYPGMGVLHLDAHADLRDAYEGFTWSHASIMHNVVAKLGIGRLVQVGIRDLGEAEHHEIEGSGGRIVTFFDAELAARRFAGETFGAQCTRIVEHLPRDVYLSWDIDGLDPTLCPHTGTPVPGGLSFQQASFLLRTLVESGRRVVGFDLNEVAPGPDGDEWDGNVGARLLYKMIGWAVRVR
jgi:agmatinase